MDITSTSFLSGFTTIVIAWLFMMVVEWVWLKPKKLEKWLRQQGFSGNSYRLFHGDMKEMLAMRKDATTKPINLSDSHHNIVPRILPFDHHIITKYGKNSFIWYGPTPSINITDPKMIRDILFKHDIFQKPKTNPFAKLLASGMFSYIAGWRFLPTARNRRMRSNYNETRALIKGIIKKREEAVRVGEASQNDDLLGMLIESNYKEMQEHGNKENGMSIEEVIDECKLFYLAGQETTASLLIWALILLCIHPHWQALAREEVFQVFGNDKPKSDDLNHLKIVNNILNEALRLYPPATILTRTTYRQTKLGEMNLRPGISLSMPLIMVHHDDEYWGDDAKEFNPDRFSQGVSKASKNNEVSFFPFGWGPRICIGQNFTLMESKLALAMILQNFSLELSPTYVHAPTRGLTIQPQFGAPLILHKI
ncbi:hypothetical protein ACOSQ2_031422 [Xanthoceras sorbifolium]